MSRTSILFVVGEGTAAAVGRLMRGQPRVAHVATTSDAALRTLTKWRAIGVVAIEADGDAGSALELLAQLRTIRPALRTVILAGHRALGDVLAAAPDARLVAAPWTDRMLLSAVDGAAHEAETLRRSKMLERIATRRLARIRELEGSTSAFSAETARRLAESNARLRQSAVGLARLVAVLAEGGDPDLCSKRERVARTAVALARRMGWSIADVEDVRFASLLADVGRAWSANESGFDLEGRHAERSAAALSPLPFSRAVVAGVRHHHERWDGMGAPSALRGNDIPKVARLLSLAEAFVAYVEGDDAYEGMPEQEAVAELSREAGRAHDPEMVEALRVMVGDAAAEEALPDLALAGSTA